MPRCDAKSCWIVSVLVNDGVIKGQPIIPYNLRLCDAKSCLLLLIMTAVGNCRGTWKLVKRIMTRAFGKISSQYFDTVSNHRLNDASFEILLKGAARRVMFGTESLKILHDLKMDRGCVRLVGVFKSFKASVVWDAIPSCLEQITCFNRSIVFVKSRHFLTSMLCWKGFRIWRKWSKCSLRIGRRSKCFLSILVRTAVSPQRRWHSLYAGRRQVELCMHIWLWGPCCDVNAVLFLFASSIFTS